MAFNEQLCGDSLEIEFSTYIFVRSWMEVVDTDINDVNVTFAVNAKNLTATSAQIPYGESITVPSPCGDGEITVDNVMLNVARLNGYIGYYVGAELLYTDETKVTLEKDDSTDNPSYISKIVTASDICIIDNVDFLILDPNETETIDIAVKVVDVNLASNGVNDSGDRVYLVTGKFIITKAESTDSETP